MKSKAINSMKYSGIVTISQSIKGKKIKLKQVHNEGTLTLFNFLADCLIGDFDIAKASQPTKIMLLEYKDKDAKGSPLATPTYESKSGFLHLVNKPEKELKDNKSIVRYSFILSRDNLQGSNFNRIALYTNSVIKVEDCTNFAAICPATLDSQLIESATALIVDWELILSNKDEEVLTND